MFHSLSLWTLMLDLISYDDTYAIVYVCTQHMLWKSSFVVGSQLEKHNKEPDFISKFRFSVARIAHSIGQASQIGIDPCIVH